MNHIIDKNLSNGLLTKIWGPGLWTALHCISFGYPINPTDDDKKNYKNYFVTTQYVLPCKFCRQSYKEYIESKPTEITDAVFENRQTLTKWLYLLHERINKKLDVSYNVTYDHVCQRYESFRAKCDPNQSGCIMPLDIKAKSFEIALAKDYPIIPYKLALCFKSYATKRNISFDNLEKYNELSTNIRCSEWTQRNIECGEIVTNMRIKGVSSIEKDGEYKDLPSISELLLISKLTSTMCINDLYKLAAKFGYNIIKVYKLVDSLLM